MNMNDILANAINTAVETNDAPLPEVTHDSSPTVVEPDHKPVTMTKQTISVKGLDEKAVLVLTVQIRPRGIQEVRSG